MAGIWLLGQDCECEKWRVEGSKEGEGKGRSQNSEGGRGIQSETLEAGSR